MTHADLHRLSPDEPVWGLVALLAAHRYTGEVAVATTPAVTMWALDGRVYLAERADDPPIATRLEREGLVTPAQLQQGAVLVGDHLSLARLFSRRPDVDRDAVELWVSVDTDSVLTAVGAQPVGAAQWAPLRHHPSGVHLWSLVPGTAPAPAPAPSPSIPAPTPSITPPAAPVVAVVAESTPAAPHPTPAPTVPRLADTPRSVPPQVPPSEPPSLDAAAGTPSELERLASSVDLDELGDFDLDAVRAAILATPPPSLDAMEPLPTIDPTPISAPANHPNLEAETQAVWDMVDRLHESALPPQPAPVPRRRWWRRGETEPRPTATPRQRPMEEQSDAPAPAPAKQKAKKQKLTKQKPTKQKAKKQKPTKRPKPTTTPDTPSAEKPSAEKPKKEPRAPKPPRPPKPRKVKAKKQPVIIPNKPKPTKARPPAEPTSDAQPNGGTE